METSPDRAFYESAYASDWRAGETYATRFTKMWYRSFLTYILPTIPLEPGSRVLEVGSGYGYLAPFVSGLGAHYIGVDLAASAVAQIPAVRGCHGLVGNGCELPFGDKQFDVVICMEVIEHLRNPRQLVSECRRVASPGASLVFSCPNYINLFMPFKLLADFGVRWFRTYMVRQPVDRTTTAVHLRHLLKAPGIQVYSQRAVRLAPPLFERLDARFPYVNDWIFKVEGRFGNRFPFKWLGLHTICVANLA